MPGDFGIVYPPWNHTGGAADFLERVVGEVGIDHVTIPVVTGECTQFRLRLLPESPYFHTEGGWHFPVNGKLYAALGFRPKAAKWLGSRDVLASLRDRAADLGLAVYFRLDVLYAAPLIQNAHHLRQRNAWGDAYVHAPACICNPELRELLRLTVADLTRYDPTGFQFANTYADRPPTVGLGGIEQLAEFLNICFCPACRQVASSAVDPDQAARSVRVCAEGLRSPKQNDANIPERDTDDVLEAYCIQREATVRQLLDQIAARYPGRRFARGYAIGQPSERYVLQPIERVVELKRSNCATLFEFPPSYIHPVLTKTFWRLLEEFRPNAEVRVPLARVLEAHEDEPSLLVQTVAKLAAAGVFRLDFDGLDEAPLEAVTWLKQAVRYTRRG